jgi:hypothetical protein
MADISRHPVQHEAHTATMAGHPDLAEMRQRYSKVLGGPRTTVTDGLIVLAGLWLAVSPWVLHFNTTASAFTIVNLILGLAIAAIGLACAIVPERIAGLGGALAAAGLFVIGLPFAINLFSTTAKLVASNASTGGLIALCGLASIMIAWMARRKAFGRAAAARRAAAAESDRRTVDVEHEGRWNEQRRR